MGQDDAVYLAKLAEQAERYEGTFYLFKMVDKLSWGPRPVLHAPCANESAAAFEQRWLRT
jgi:hypothetical protein